MKLRKSRALAAVALAGSFVALALPMVTVRVRERRRCRASTFNTNFTTMKYLTSVVEKGQGQGCCILPDTTSSARYVDFDAPMMKQAMKAAGLPAKDLIVQNGEGSDNTVLHGRELRRRRWREGAHHRPARTRRRVKIVEAYARRTLSRSSTTTA